jgi:hypothetical protein
MSTRAWAGSAIAIGAAGVLVAVLATAAPGQSAAPADDPPHTITVSSFATISSVPDEAVITFGVHAVNADSVVALNQSSRTLNGVLRAMKSLGITERDMETTNVNVSPRVINRGTPSETTIYASSTSLEVTIRDFDVIGTAIRDGIEAGATRVRGVRFQVSDPTGAKTRALEAAVRSARAKADALAQAAGTSVTGVVQIREQGSGGYPSPYVANERALAYAAADLSIVPPRIIESKVTVRVVWSVG